MKEHFMRMCLAFMSPFCFLMTIFLFPISILLKVNNENVYFSVTTMTFTSITENSKR